MVSILILSNHYEGVPLAIRLSEEGHICKVHFNGSNNYLKNSTNPSIVANPKKLIEQYDLILQFPYSGQEDLIKEAKELNKVTLGGKFNNKLYTEVEYINSIRDMLHPEVTLIENEEFLNLAITAWFYHGEITVSYLSFPYTKFMERDKGYTAMQGMVTQSIDLNSKLIKQTFTCLIPLLEKVKYTGPLTLHLNLSKDNCLWLNFNPFIDETFYSFIELLKCSTFDFLYKVLQGKGDTALREDVSISCCLSIPPYPYEFPYEKMLEVKDYVDVPKPAIPHSYLLPLTLTGFLGFLTARGGNVNEARRRLYRTVNNSVLNNTVQYRSDIGLTYDVAFNKLKEWEWLSNGNS